MCFLVLPPLDVNLTPTSGPRITAARLLPRPIWWAVCVYWRLGSTRIAATSASQRLPAGARGLGFIFSMIDSAFRHDLALRPPRAHLLLLDDRVPEGTSPRRNLAMIGQHRPRCRLVRWRRQGLVGLTFQLMPFVRRFLMRFTMEHAVCPALTLPLATRR